MADREGRLKDQPRAIKAEVFPYYDCDVNGELTVIERLGLIRRYKSGNTAVIEVLNFKRHQHPHNTERASDLPAYVEEKPLKTRQKSTKRETNGSLTVDPPLDNAGNPADSLIPSSLIPSLLIPDSLNPEKKVPSEPMSDAKPPDDVQTVFEHWRSTWNHPRTPLTPERQALIRRALKHFSAADLCESISGYRNSPHHTGQNDRSTVYDSIELLLRDAKRIDAGLRFARAPPQLTSPTTQHNVTVLQQWRPPEERNADSGFDEISDGNGESRRCLHADYLAANH